MRKLLVLALLLATSFAASASSVHVSRRKYEKEVRTIVAQYTLEIGNYQHNPPAGTDGLAASLYVTLVKADLTLVSNKLTLFKKHRTTQDEVDKVLAQLSRDIEDAPTPGGPSIYEWHTRSLSKA